MKFLLFSGNITEVKQLMKEVKVDCIGDVSTGKTLLRNTQLQKIGLKEQWRSVSDAELLISRSWVPNPQVVVDSSLEG